MELFQAPEICDLCGEPGVRVRRVARNYGKGLSLMVIDDIPVVDCPHCGKSYMTPETIQRIERIKANRPSKF
jgi:YgiT-type zinc finger domain-containing protein